MTLTDFLGQVTKTLDLADVRYMLTGSLASSYYGEPRSTQDIDVVAAVGASEAGTLSRAFTEAGFYVSEPAALEAVRSEGQFNVIDGRGGWKVDIMVLKSRPFSQSEFDRRREIEYGDLRLSIVSPEDLILAKLEWAQLGASERQLRDAARIFEIQGEALDLSYIERWIDELGVAESWRQIQGRS